MTAWLFFPLLIAATLFAQQPATPPSGGTAQTPPAAGQPAPAAQASDQPPPPPYPPAGQKLANSQLDGLVAPIALYPDPLVSQILVAATYPREITLAVQWLNQNPALKGQDLTNAAQAQSWDPSVKALVMFPGVLRRLNQDKVWTTNLGNAFLAQQADVMQAVQRMRKVAKDAGKLKTTRQMKVVETTDSGQTVIEVVPANPDVIFVPAYNPAWIWGPPLWYPYPRWFWGPPPIAAGVVFGFGPAITMGAYYGPAWGGWGGWGGWGWRPGWGNNSIVVNNTFINNTAINNTAVSSTGTLGGASTNVGTNPTPPGPSQTGTSPPGVPSTSTTGTPAPSTTNPSTGTTTGTPVSAAKGTTPSNTSATTGAPVANATKGTPAAGNSTTPNAALAKNSSPTSVWTHDPSHRQGVPYPNAEVAQRFHAPPPRPAGAAQPRPQAAAARPAGAGKGKALAGKAGGGKGGGKAGAGKR